MRRRWSALLPTPGAMVTAAMLRLVVALLLLGGAPALAQPAAPDCSTPQQAADTLFRWLQPDAYDPAKAATCLDLPPGSQGGRLAVQLKQVLDARGEAVGINYVGAQDKATLIQRLADCADSDYFERGIELAIEHDAMRVLPIDIGEMFAVEVDFEEDLDRANEHL